MPNAINWDDVISSGGKIAQGSGSSTIGNIGSGMATGATVGSIIPGVGNLIGGIAGGLIGGVSSLFGGSPKEFNLSQSEIEDRQRFLKSKLGETEAQKLLDEIWKKYCPGDKYKPAYAQALDNLVNYVKSQNLTINLPNVEVTAPITPKAEVSLAVKYDWVLYVGLGLAVFFLFFYKK